MKSLYFEDAEQIFLKEGATVWFLPVQASAGMAYRLIPFRFEHCRYWYSLWN